MKPLIIELGFECATMCLANGESVKGSEYESDVLACCSQGDVEPFCQYLLDHVGIEFRIVAKNTSGEYENRIGTKQEKQTVCEAIYFDSETDFSDEDKANLYLVWEASDNVQH